MRGQYRAKKERGRSRFYILLSIIFVAIMLKWGIPAFLNTVSGPEMQKKQSLNEKDIIPPQQPVLSAVPEATNSAKITLQGYTESGAQVELMVNDVVSGQTTADDSGLFSFDTTLKTGSNTIIVTAKDAAGNASMSPTTTITYDNTPVKLTVDSPKDGDTFFGQTNQTVTVSGKVSKSDSQVLVNNNFAQVGSDGAFSYRMTLTDGDNPIHVVATDKSGNTDDAMLTVVFHS